MYIEIVILLLLFLLNGFFALSEISLVSSKKQRLEQKKNEGSRGAEIALKLLENSENFLSAIQVGITLIGIITGVYGGASIADDISPFFLNFELTALHAKEIGLGVTILIITYISIVIGELVPKTIALSNPEKVSIIISPIIYYFSLIFHPFVFLLSLSTNLINNLIGIKKTNDFITEADLIQLLKSASSEGVIEKEQNFMHEKVFYFSDKKAKHIMTHRTDLEWINANKPINEIKDAIFASKHSRIIFCNDSFNEIKGVINVIDFLKLQTLGKKIDLDEIVSEPIIIPWNLDATKVLDLMRLKNNHLCCVVDEYGCLVGIITFHDIIENIVGEIPDEGEAYEPDVFIREDNSILVSGDAPIETLTNLIVGFDVDFDLFDYSTVAGFAFKQIDKIPQIGDKFIFKDYSFEIVDIDAKKIDKLLITKL